MFTIPETVSFEEAIALSQSLLDLRSQEDVSDAALQTAVSTLVQSETGARGFFVTYLSDQRSLMDQLIPTIASALYAAPAVVSSLLVKNLAMSTAMALTHRRNQHEALAIGSDRVRSRTSRLVQELSFPELREQAQALATSIELGTGTYQTFLERWSYDQEQKQAMHQALNQAGLLSETTSTDAPTGG